MTLKSKDMFSSGETVIGYSAVTHPMTIEMMVNDDDFVVIHQMAISGNYLGKVWLK
jgi:hypothetical protein